MKLILALLVSFGLATPAAADQRFEFASYEIPSGGRIVMPVVKRDSPGGVAAAIDQRTDGALTVAASEAAFSGEIGTTLTLYGVSPYSRIDLIGVGAEGVGRVVAERYLTRKSCSGS